MNRLFDMKILVVLRASKFNPDAVERFHWFLDDTTSSPLHLPGNRGRRSSRRAREVQTGMKRQFGDDICSSQTAEITAMTAVVANSLKLTEVPAKRWPR